VIVALTANGPGEFAGWVRPLLVQVYAGAPETDVRLFFVPDDYATGREADVARALFPRAHVYPPREYLRFAFGGRLGGLPARVDRVQYLGGDLMHAARVHKRLGGIATSYKFSRRAYRKLFERVFAVDENNRRQLGGWGTPDERIRVVGNLAIDGALAESSGAYGDPPSDAARDGIILLPGSRRHEVANLYPFFVAVAVALRRRLGDVRIAFGRSPFTTDSELDAALRAGGDPRAYGSPAELTDGGTAIRSGEHRFALVRATMRSAVAARLAISIPGTKLIELAAIGVPSICCLPMNAPELAVINGPLQYLGRLPGIGAPLKRAAAVAVTKRFRFFAQPNIDAERELIPELSGTLFPARVAAVAAEHYADHAWCERTGAELRVRYAVHAGAAKRMSAALLAPG
jgi:lipid-A-disaccharide synthase